MSTPRWTLASLVTACRLAFPTGVVVVGRSPDTPGGSASVSWPRF